MQRLILLLAMAAMLPIGCGTSTTTAPTAPNTLNSRGTLITTPGEHQLPGPCIRNVVLTLDQTGTLHHTIKWKNASQTDHWSATRGWFVFVEADSRRIWTWTGSSLCVTNIPTDAVSLTTRKTPANMSILYAAPAEVFERLSAYLTSDSAQAANAVPATVAPQPKSE